MSPLLNSVVEAIDRGVRSKAHPWKITISNFYEDIERARILFSGLTNSNPENIAIIPSASYGIQIAANNIKIKAGKKILILKDQFPSNVYHIEHKSPWDLDRFCFGSRHHEIQRLDEVRLKYLRRTQSLVGR